jgi:hypothetical protein
LYKICKYNFFEFFINFVGYLFIYFLKVYLLILVFVLNFVSGNH